MGFCSKIVGTFNNRRKYEPENESGLLVDTAQNIIFCCPLWSLVNTYATVAPHTHALKKVVCFYLAEHSRV